jgi:AraC-like DNA-binding protein
MKEKLRIPEQMDGFSFDYRPPVRFPVAAHHHEELEVGFVASGSATYLIEHGRVPLRVGTMIWLFPKQEHILVDASRDFVMWIAMFRQNLVRRCTNSPERQILRSEDPGTILCHQLDPGSLAPLSAIFKAAKTAGMKGDYEFANAALQYALLAAWQTFQFSGTPALLTNVHPAVASAARILSQSDEPVSLPKLARLSGISSARLSRLFKEQTGVSLTVFRQRNALDRFIRIFGQGRQYSLIEAALRAGFGSYPQFHRVFRNHMKLSPAEYARQVRASTEAQPVGK